MAVSLLHTPEGVRDIYNGECARKLAVQDRISGVFHLYGYEDIETPTFEYFDIFNKERGSVTSQEMFKFFDRDNNTLVLRPDITPSIARCVGKYFSDQDSPVRLCYRERTFTNNTSYQGRLKEVTQTGVELIGDDGSGADGEMIAMVIDSLKAAGLKEFQIGVGHVDFFRGLVKEADLQEDIEQELMELISNKNFFGVEELLDSLRLSKELKELFSMLGNPCMSEDMILRAKELASKFPLILNAIKRLAELADVLKCYGVEKYISIELGMLSSYHYYTGIIFAGYTFGSGEPIVKGGRYDHLLNHFGKDAPSIGFAVVIDQLLAALSRQKIKIPVEDKGILMVYKNEKAKDAIREAETLRNQGNFVSLVTWEDSKSQEEYQAYAARMHMVDVRFLK